MLDVCYIAFVFLFGFSTKRILYYDVSHLEECWYWEEMVYLLIVYLIKG